MYGDTMALYTLRASQVKLLCDWFADVVQKLELVSLFYVTAQAGGMTELIIDSTRRRKLLSTKVSSGMLGRK